MQAKHRDPVRTVAPNELPRKRYKKPGKGHLTKGELEVIDMELMKVLGVRLAPGISINDRVQIAKGRLSKRGKRFQLADSTIKKRVLALEMRPPRNAEEKRVLAKLRENVKQRRRKGWGGSRDIKTTEERAEYWRRIREEVENPENEFRHPVIADRLGVSAKALNMEMSRMRTHSLKTSISVGGALRRHIFNLTEINPYITVEEVAEDIGRSVNRTKVLMQEVQESRAMMKELRAKRMNVSDYDFFKDWHVYGKEVRARLK